MRTDRWRTITWLAGLLVVAAAGVATAHGLYEVARSADVPPAIAALYPAITDGLALLAYACTIRLGVAGKRYAAVVMVLAAGLSGLAQAVYLAGGVGASASVALRFGVGAWPAVAAIVAAHLVHLMVERPGQTGPAELEDQAGGQARPDTGPDQAGGPDRDQATRWRDQANERARAGQAAAGHVARAVTAGEAGQDQAEDVEAGQDVADTRTPRERARDWAALTQLSTGTLPTVREVAAGANVGRETAGKALQELRVASNGHSHDTQPRLAKP